MFPATYPKSMSPYANHELFGNALIPNSTTLYENPYAKMVSGYSAKKTSRINAQFELRQDLKFITDGLKIRAMGYVERYSEFEVSRNFNPFFIKLTQMNMEISHYCHITTAVLIQLEMLVLNI